MIEIQGKFEAGFFGDFSSVTPTPDTVTQLTQAFRDRNLIPSTYQELDLSGSVPRIRLATTDHEWHIDFESRKISIEKIGSPPRGENLGTIECFSRDVEDMVGRVLKIHDIRGTRLSLVTVGLMGEMTVESLNSVYDRVCRPQPFFQAARPDEWSLRTVGRVPLVINEKEENTNVLVRLGRIQGRRRSETGIKDFDRIEIVFDINTYQRNSAARFNVSTLAEFLVKAIDLRRTLLSELEGQLNG